MKEKNIVDVEEMEDCVEETETEGRLAKIGRGIKKHGKKVVVAAALGATALIAYALGSKTSREDSDYTVEPETETFEVTDYSDTTEE